MQDLYLFNPDNEISIANGTNGYTPKANISIMASDLAYLSAYLSNKGDYVLVSGIPDVAFIRSREGIFGLDCKPVVWEKAQIITFNELKPWGWSPRVHNLLKDLKKVATNSSAGELWQNGVMGDGNYIVAEWLPFVWRKSCGLFQALMPRSYRGNVVLWRQSVVSPNRKTLWRKLLGPLPVKEYYSFRKEK